jgi:hypothetical protein
LYACTSIFTYKNTDRKKEKEKFTRLHISLFLHVWFPHYSSFGCLVLKKEKGTKKRKETCLTFSLLTTSLSAASSWKKRKREKEKRKKSFHF